MSNKVDDIYHHAKFPRVLGEDDKPPGDLALIKADGQYKVSDRTHKVKLGDVVVSKYELTPNAFASSKDYRVSVRSYAKVVFTSLFGPDKKIILNEAGATKLIEGANEQYAQVGILLVMKYKQAPVVIPGVNLGEQGFDRPAPTANDDPTKLVRDTAYLPETRAVLDNPALRTAANDDIEIFIVNYLFDRYYGSGLSPDGTKIAKANAIAPEDCNVIFLSALGLNLSRDPLRPYKPFTVGHEIGHVLTNAGHYIAAHRPVNLMRDRGTSTTDVIGASKRLFESQDALIRTASPELLFDQKPL